MNLSTKISANDLIAVGDIHGRYDLFAKFLDAVKGTQAQIILCGDLVDRGSNDLQVLETAKALNENPSSHGLQALHIIRGNHEQMLIDASYGKNYDCWVDNGGDEANKENLFEFVPWLESLPHFITGGNTLFVHAGIKPGVPMPSQKADDLIWIREPFLSSPNLKLDKVFPGKGITQVVHGHSPLKAMFTGDTTPEVTKQRVNLDTWAYETGVLTAFNVTQNAFMQFEMDPALVLA